MHPDLQDRVVVIAAKDRKLAREATDHLGQRFARVISAHSREEALGLCSETRVDAVVLHQGLCGLDGLDLCTALRRHNERLRIVMLAEEPRYEFAVRALREGASDCLNLPVDLDVLGQAVERAMLASIQEQSAELERYRTSREELETILVGDSEVLRGVIKLIELAGSVNAPVLITGETGTGKNVVARAIHYRSRVRKEAFLAINCAALPESLIEAELFGFEKGAFTGAVASRRGIFEMASGGTLFLDEIGEMPTHLQTKLLGVLEDKKVRRVGGDTFRPVDVRLIASTCVNLDEVLNRSFRRDLYYRLSVIRIHLPPLRERPEDIPALCQHFLGLLVSGRRVRLEDSELARVMAYDWPGNVRELKNLLERASIVQPGPIIRPSELLGAQSPTQLPLLENKSDDRLPTLRELEQEHIRRVLEHCSFNLTRSATVLGISLSTLKRKVKTYGLK